PDAAELAEADGRHVSDLGRAQRAGEVVEHAVGEAGLAPFEKGVGDADIFAHRHLGRDVLAVDDLERAGFEPQPQDRLQPRQRPFLAERGGDDLVEPVAVADDAADDLGEERLVGLAVSLAVDLAAEPVRGKLAHHPLGPKTGVQLKLIELLHRREPRHPPPPPRPAGTARTQRAPPANRRFNPTIARQALTALPPMSRPSTDARASACASFSQVAMPKPTGSPSRTARSCNPRVLSLQT